MENEFHFKGNVLFNKASRKNDGIWNASAATVQDVFSLCLDIASLHIYIYRLMFRTRRFFLVEQTASPCGSLAASL